MTLHPEEAGKKPPLVLVVHPAVDGQWQVSLDIADGAPVELMLDWILLATATLTNSAMQLRDRRTARQVEVSGYLTELEYDLEIGTWHFRVPELHIVGGGQKNLEEAIRAAAEAIAFTLEPSSSEA